MNKSYICRGDPMWSPEHTSKCHKFIWILIYLDEHITGDHMGSPLQVYAEFTKKLTHSKNRAKIVPFYSIVIP